MQIKTANGQQRLTMTKSDWEAIGKKAGWTNQLDKEAMGSARSQAVESLLKAQEMADTAIMARLQAGEAEMPEDLQRAWRQLGENFAYVMRFL